VFLGCGVYITFFGWKKWRNNFRMIVALPTFFITSLNIFGLFTFTTPEVFQWIALAACAAGAYYASRYAYDNLVVGFYMIGSYIGIVISLIFYQSFLANLNFFNLMIIGILITGGAVGGGIYGLRYWM
jgi:hypothetical protein